MVSPGDNKQVPTPPDLLERPELLGGRLRSMGLPLALAICIGVALVLTGVSIGLYYASNLSRIDLSKPKYADIREDVLSGGDNTQDGALDTDSPITKEAVSEAIAEMSKRQKDLQQLGGFDSPVLNDAQLGLDAKTPATQ